MGTFREGCGHRALLSEDGCGRRQEAATRGKTLRDKEAGAAKQSCCHGLIIYTSKSEGQRTLVLHSADPGATRKHTLGHPGSTPWTLTKVGTTPVSQGCCVPYQIHASHYS